MKGIDYLFYSALIIAGGSLFLSGAWSGAASFSFGALAGVAVFGLCAIWVYEREPR